MMLGVARLTIETANVEEGEFAIVVRDAYQRKGIGSKLMDALIQAARDRHVREIRGHVLAANPGMTRFAEDLGFDVRPYVLGTVVTFEEATVPGASWASASRSRAERRAPWLVARGGRARRRLRVRLDGGTAQRLPAHRRVHRLPRILADFEPT